MSSNGRAPVKKAFGLTSAINTYLQQLTNLRQPAFHLAKQPLEAHSWVFAAAMAISTMSSQAPLVVFTETEEELDKRRRLAKRRGNADWWKPAKGKYRRAFMRHLNKGPNHKRMLLKAAEPDLDHPVMDLFMRPNPIQDGVQLQQTTDLWLAIRGEVFWVYTDDMGNPTMPGEMPTRIWPLGPDGFEPMLTNGQTGDLFGWWYRPPYFMPNGTTGAQRLPLPLSAVTQFKFSNPEDPLRGLSRLTAVARNVEQDLLAAGHQSSLLRNKATPKGVISAPDAMDEDEEEEYLAKWEEQFGDEHKSGGTALLTGGFKYQVVSLTPDQMQTLERESWNKDQVLAVMGVPDSVLGFADNQTFATQLGQDRNFIDKTISPLWRMKERAIDASPLVAAEPDSTFVAHDLSDVEALRAGIDEKVTIAGTMTGQNLHMPPRTAYDLIGLEVPEYPGDDQAFVPPLSVTVDDVLGGGLLSDEPAVDVEAEVEAHLALHEFNVQKGVTRFKQQGGKRWRQFVLVEIALEKKMRGRYRGWVAREREATLERFREATKAKNLRDSRLKQNFDINFVLGDLLGAQNALRSVTRPIYTAGLDQTFNFTESELGIPIFDIDDPLIIRFFDRRETKFVDNTPRTLRRNLENTIRQAIENGETIQQIRRRMSQVFDVSRSSAKALQVARTEMSGFMNGVRDEMFGLQGFTEEDWTTAGDENVRDDHVEFGNAGPQARGFNWLELVGKPGTLRYPGDIEGPAGQVINCRCVKIPVG